MNRIYKVIWSKVRNCYVAVSEIAKRNGKGGGAMGGAVVDGASLNCSAKAKRSRAILALAVSLWIGGGGVASAAWTQDKTFEGPDNRTYVYNGELTVVAPSSNIDSLISGYRTTLSNQIFISESAYGGYSRNFVTGNAIILKDSQVRCSLYGGYVNSVGSANNNRVTAIGSTIGDAYDAAVYGGYSYLGEATGNSVILVDSTVGSEANSANVFGGFGLQSATNNTVTLQDATVTGNVSGGDLSSVGNITGNTLNLFYGTKGNTVGGTVQNFEKIVLQDSFAMPDADKMEEQYKTLTLEWTPGATLLSANKFTNIGTLDITAATNLANAATRGTMTLLASNTAGDFDSMKLAYDAATQTNPVALTTSGVTYAAKELVDGNDATRFYTNENKVALANGNKDVTYTVGPRHIALTDTQAKSVTFSAEPTVSHTEAGYIVDVDKLYLADGFKSMTVAVGTWKTLTDLYAGYSTTGADLSDYSLSVTGGNLERNIPFNLFGAYGDNTGTDRKTMSGNAVNINGGEIKIKEASSITTTINPITLYGGYIVSGSWTTGDSSAADFAPNAVNISGGTLITNNNDHNSTRGVISIYGTWNDSADATVSGGAVNITGGVLSSAAPATEAICIGGIGNSRSASSGGAVAISGTWDNNKQAPATRLLATGDNSLIEIYAADTGNSSFVATGGSVMLSGDVGFQGIVELYGRGDQATGTGNTLHIGTNDKAWRGYKSTDGNNWKLKNTVSNVNNFDTIALHRVAFSSDTPVLQANGLYYYSGNSPLGLDNVTLDLTNLSFADGDGNDYAPTAGDTMTLLAAQDNLSGLKLAYDDTTQTTPVALTTDGVVVGSYKVTDGSDDKFYKGLKTVALANGNKDVTYTIGKHLSYTDKTDTENKAVTLYAQPSASDAEAGYTVDKPELCLADDFKSLNVAGGTWNTLNNIFAGYTTESVNPGADLSGYSLAVTGGSLTQSGVQLYGVYGKNPGTDRKTMSGNAVNIAGGSIKANYLKMFGGCIANGSWTTGDSSAASFAPNAVNISGGTLTGGIASDLGTISIYGTMNSSADAVVTGGTVKITGGVLSAAVSNAASNVDAIRIGGIGNSNSDSSGGAVSISGEWNNENSAPATQLLATGNNSTIGIYAAEANNASFEATGGSVTLSGDVGFQGKVVLYGRGNKATGTGNTLHIGTDGDAWRGWYTRDGNTWNRTNAVTTVHNFDTIALHRVAFTADTPALQTDGLYYSSGDTRYGPEKVTLDLTNLSFADANGTVYTPAAGDSMTLLSAKNTNLSGLKLVYDAATQANPVALTAEGVAVKLVDRSSGENGVRWSADEAHIVSLVSDNGTYKSVTYGVKDYYSGFSFGKLAWEKDGTAATVIDANAVFSGITVNDDGSTSYAPTTADASQLSFIPVKTSGNAAVIAAGDSMTLLSMEGLTVFANLNGIEKTIAATHTGANGAAFHATATGAVSSEKGAVKYAVTGVTLDSVNLEDWDSGKAAVAVPTGWSANASGVTVETDGMAAPSGIKPGEKNLILTGGDDFFANVAVSGKYAYTEGTALDDGMGENGVVLTGKQDAGGVKADDTDKSKLVYQEYRKTVSGITLGEATFAANGTARTLDNTYDATTAAIDTSGLSFTEDSRKKMEAGDSMTILDASNAIKDGSGHALPAFTTQKTSFVVGFTDEVTDKGLTFKGTHTDTLSQDSGQTKIIYTVGSKTVSGDDAVALTGAITWNDGGTHYTNTKYTFDSTAKTNLDSLNFGTVNSDPYGTSMTLISGSVDGTVINAPASFGVSLVKTNTTLEATAAGSAAIDSGDLKYTVSGVTLDKVMVKSVGDTADTVPTNWTLAKDGSGNVTATVETDNMTAPSGMNPGEVKAILTGGDNFFANVTVSGKYAYTEGTALDDGTGENGVLLTGKQDAGGVKADDTDKSKLVYQEYRKTVSGITLGEATFAANGTARTLDKTYDATTAAIDTSGLSFTEDSRKKMEAGDAMTVLDASTAIQNASGETLKALDTSAKTSFAVDFTDTITDKGLTFAGTHTDTLALADDSTTSTKQSKLIYTVGDKNVSTATLSGAITWSDGGTHYTNTKYTFDSTAKTNLSGLTFGTTNEDPYGTSMTLISGSVDGTVINTPASFGVSLAKTNTTLEATAAGSASIDSGNLKYTVSGVTLDKVTVKGVGDTADTVPINWTLAKDGSGNVTATVETDNMAAPSGMNPGEVKAILTGGDNFFANVTVGGKYAYTEGTALDDGTGENGVLLTGKQDAGGVKADDTDKSKLVYQEYRKTVSGITLGEATFAANGTARTLDKTYDATTAAIDTDALAFSNSNAMEAGDAMTVLDASTAIQNASGETLKALDTSAKTSFAVDFTDTITDKGLTFAGTHTDTLALADDSTTSTKQSKLIYTVGDKNVSTATLSGAITWSDGGVHYTNGSDANQNGTKATYKFDGNSDVNISGVSFAATADPLEGATKSMTLLKGVDGVDANKVSGTPAFTLTLDQTNTTLEATATGSASIDSGDLKYTVSGVTLDKVTVKGVGDTADTVPINWTLASGATIETDGMTIPTVEAGKHIDILQSDTDNFFANAKFNGANAYKAAAFTENENGVTVAGSQSKGVTLNSEKKHIIYAVGTKDVDTVTLGSVTWQKGDTLFDGSSAEYDYTKVTALATKDFALTYAAPESVAVNDSMTLLKANATLADMAEQIKQSSYSYNPVSGVTVDAAITGKLTTSSGVVTYTPIANQASKLTFTNVEWKDSGALMTRPANITFAGADVDTAKINFHNIQELAANSRMTLVSDFGETVGTITGDTFTVGSGLKGEGAASLSGTDLIFTAKTGAESLTPTEATHETVMAMEAGTAVVAAGREYVDSAVEGLGLVSNMAPDGTSTFASMGGGVGRYKTGSHVDTHTWSAVVAVGSKREHKKGSLEWGVFAEYGRGNYTLHDDNGGRGDGNTNYAGGGLLAKWTNKHDVYTEASFRMGRMSDSASNMLRDVLGNMYGYNVHANYFGAHVGLGKIIKVKKNRDLDVYGKYFYLRRNGVNFDAGGNHYTLDSVASSLLRIGARYGSNDKKWNWYGGLAYEYEFDGQSKGNVDGLAIRSASIKGGSVRGEIGMRMEATKTNPWKVDIGIYGYGGKHRGFGGNVSVAYMF